MSKVSQQTSASTLTGSETIYVVQGGNSRKTTVTGVLDAATFSQSASYGSGSVGEKLQQIVSVKDQPYGAKGDGVTDDTAAIQAAINACIASGAKLNGAPGTFLVGTLSISTVNNFTWDLQGATLRIKPSGSFASIITVLDCRGTSISNGTLDGNQNTSLTTALRTYSDQASGSVTASYSTYTKIRVINSVGGFVFGDSGFPAAPSVSENVLVQCNCIDVARPLIAYGINTEVDAVGCNLTSNASSWASGVTNQYTVSAIGGVVRMTGGEIVSHVLGTTPGLNIQPIDTGSVHQYGAILCVGTWMECQSQYATATNPGSLGSCIGGILKLSNCAGALIDDTAIAVDVSGAGFTGSVRVQDCWYFASVARSHANIKADAGIVMQCDNVSFGSNFLQGTAGFLTGTFYDDSTHQAAILIASQNSVTSLVDNTWTKVTFGATSVDTLSAFSGNNKYTPTIAGYYVVCATVQLASAAHAIGVDIYLNGASTGYTVGGVELSVLNSTGTNSKILHMNGTTDFIEIFAFQKSGGAINTVTVITQLSIAYVRGG